MASSLFQAYASLAASMMMIRSMANDIVPHELRSYICSKFNYLFTPLSKNLTIIIDEYSGMARNQVYDAVEIYLQTKLSPSNSCIQVSKTQKQKNFTVTIVNGEEIVDEFENCKLHWRFVYAEPQQNGRVQEKKFFELSFNKKFKDRVLDSYLPYVMDRAQKILKEEKVVRLYSRDCPFDDDIRSPGGCNGNQWGSINLEHPCTFDTIALDPELKKMIIDDLDRFLRRKEFYKKVGKAWKRGYLLYGPPGTGKSSLIAAMANYLKFDIYDLDLTSVYSDSDLRRVLLSTTNRSILVIEDIDCSVEAKDRHLLEDHQESYSNQFTKFTLSGLLNFIDGLWSSCGDERIIIFTTNHKEKLDPALLRPGRMDMHVNLSYCTVDVFKQLASNYLSIDDDNRNLYGEIEELIQSSNVTPAEVAEELMRSEDTEVALEGVAGLLKRKKKQEGEIEDDANEGQEGKKLKLIDDDDEECVGRINRMCVETRRSRAERLLSIRGRGRGRRGRGSYRLFL